MWMFINIYFPHCKENLYLKQTYSSESAFFCPVSATQAAWLFCNFGPDWKISVAFGQTSIRLCDNHGAQRINPELFGGFCGAERNVSTAVGCIITSSSPFIRQQFFLTIMNRLPTMKTKMAAIHLQLYCLFLLLHVASRTSFCLTWWGFATDKVLMWLLPVCVSVC